MASGELQLSCDGGDHCLAVAVVDYGRLEPRGYRTMGVSGEPVSRQEAESIASTHLVDTLGAEPPDSADCEQEDDFIHCAMVYPNQDRYLVVVHRFSGHVVFAELELWNNETRRGYDVPLPEGYADATALGCVDAIAQPERKKTVTTGLPLDGVIPSTADEALALTRQLNLAERFTGGGAYRAFVISYAPALGDFDTESADWYVWLTMAPQ